MRQADRKAERLRRDAAELLLEEAGVAHVRRGVVPLVDAAAEREDDQLVLQPSGEPRHAVVAFHRTTLPPSTTAEW